MMGWNRMIRDVLSALATHDSALTTSEPSTEQQIAVETQDEVNP
jgi:hypothetical protein